MRRPTEQLQLFNDLKLFRIVVEHFDAVLGHENKILNAHTRILRQIDTRFDREDHARLQRGVPRVGGNAPMDALRSLVDAEQIADAVAGAVIALMMIPRAIKLLHNAVKVLLEETPDGLDLDKVREHLEDVPHVLAVHDLHASTVSTGMPILMAHVVVDKDLTMEDAATILTQLQDCLREHFPVSVPHTTFQLEPEGYSSPSSNELHE